MKLQIRFSPVFLLLFSLFSTSALSQKLTIISATSQKWQGGAFGSGGGINYSIKMIAPRASADFKIDKIWIGEKYYEPVVNKGLPKLEKDFAKGDTIQLSAAHYIPGERDKKEGNIPEEKNIPCPKKYKGDALISYTLKGKRKYFILKKIEALQQLNYP